MKKHLIFLLFTLLFISACSSKKSVIPKLESNLTTMTQTQESDEFEDEFEDEEKRVVYDPLEGYNRTMTNVNDKIYTYMFNPLSKGYAFVVPKPIRAGVSNVFQNLKAPLYIVNNLLQLKFENSAKELTRFMFNSTLGLGGIFDVATSSGIEEHKEDFGQTLGYYGVGSGFHLVLPFFGPSNLRDTIGFSIDSAMASTTNGPLPYQFPNNELEAIEISSVYYLNKNSLHLGEYENLKKDAIDVYTFFRDSYEQKRANDIKK